MLETRAVGDVRAAKLAEAAAARAADVETSASEMLGILGAGDGEVAKRNTVAGEFIVTGTAIYKAIVNIPRGAALAEGMNVVRTDMEEQLNALREKE